MTSQEQAKKYYNKIEEILNYHSIANEECISNTCLCANKIFSIIVEVSNSQK